MSGAAADFTALAEEAALAGVPERQVKALLECAVPLVFVDHTRVATVIEAARVALPAAADPSLAALVEIYGACLTMHFHGWTPELAGRVMSAAPALASITDVRTRGRIACLRAGMHCFAGEYAEARQYSEESQRCSRKAGVFFDYFLAVAYLNWAEILSGDLGASVRTTRAAIELAERNETPFPTLWFNVRLAWTQMEAYEFQRPLAMLSVRAADPQVQAVRNNGYFILLWLGMARMATHDYDGAWDAFQKLEKAIEVGGMPFQVRSPLLACQTECAVARREFAEARTLAQRLVIHSEKHHDFAFAARGHRLLADLALMESDADAAAAHIQRAMETLGRCERSLWEWRIHASAARIFARLGRLQESAESRKRARVAADRIANTLADEPELQTSFLRRVAAELETTAASA
jgi:tetratricopeptide (TPR) repeat protein